MNVEGYGVSSDITAGSRKSTSTSELSAASESKTEGFVDVSTYVFSPADWLRRSKPPTTKCSPCPNDDEESITSQALLEGLVAASQRDDDLTTMMTRKNLAASLQHSTSNHIDKDMDRREAAFAMLGMLWATTTVLFPAEPAHAVYGAEPKMELPNMAESMAKRNNGQCLVESLGNRECLVYMDPSNKLYQGADSQKLLQKIDFSSASLSKIPALVQDKKWSGVKSIITGPMGELLSTMNILAPLSTKDVNQSTALAKQVKLQVFAISAAADMKDGTAILKSHQAATDALVAFVQSL